MDTDLNYTATAVRAESGSEVSSAASSPLARLRREMWAAGWEIDLIDVDVREGVAPRAKIQVRRLDGRWLMAYVNHGRAGMERWHRRIELGMPRGVTGRSPLSPQIDDQFLGRTPCASPAELLRTLAHYVAANPGRLPLLQEGESAKAARVEAMQAAWAALAGDHHQATALAGMPAIGF